MKYPQNIRSFTAYGSHKKKLYANLGFVNSSIIYFITAWLKVTDDGLQISIKAYIHVTINTSSQGLYKVIHYSALFLHILPIIYDLYLWRAMICIVVISFTTVICTCHV